MVIVIDPQIAGISGDMILSSLVDIGADKTKIINGIMSSEKFLPNSTISEIDFKKTEKHGVHSTQLVLKINENVHERKGVEIKKAISDSVNDLGLSEPAKKFAISCIDTLINSESKIHGVSAESVHFHEASSMDTLIDIVGTAIASDDLGFFDETIVCLPVCVGSGSVTFSHGTMSNPAGAVLEILKNSGLLIQGGQVKDELTTPTGACILANLSKTCIEYYPLMEIQSIGYGAGTKDFDSFSNVLKIVRGTQKNSTEMDTVKILETNVDDVSGEILGNLIETIMKKGAKDVSIYHGITKKGRPTNLVSVICDDNTMHDIVDTLISETGTLGIRVSTSKRFILPREINETHVSLEGQSFLIKYKTASFKGKSDFKIEFEDLKHVSEKLNMSIKQVESLIRKEIEKIEE
ncbi:nickel pincer cofactor biosynthesis protein LarC [Nitrosopumilus sp. K4]|uniref:nickel pincer cofactor biosynthesis protein LarC n=1 Tax=Nitrosopumilus sp. K4 TaxID=2795383 RepID=UPI001BA987D8|nr:nickel pincer cofactor biosynthesis protein LarC [Nitrosopumilus sp. K4]QUC64198.1 nickel pincer cofactor biosynthesis protein LarC [Nitrosopumilus sp. K4]